MPRTYAEREDAYRKKLLIISSISVAFVAALFVTGDVIPYHMLDKPIGWEGDLEVVPHITIIPENDPYEDLREPSSRKAVAALDVKVHEETGPGEEFPTQQEALPTPERLTSPELDLDDIRHYPAHTDVPYSQDYVLIHMVQPEYPPTELLRGIEGDVTIEVLVDDAGAVENVWVLTAVGPKSFENSALAAVRQFRFKPPVVDGRPVQMWIRFQVRFRLVG